MCKVLHRQNNAEYNVVWTKYIGIGIESHHSESFKRKRWLLVEAAVASDQLFDIILADPELPEGYGFNVIQMINEALKGLI